MKKNILKLSIFTLILGLIITSLGMYISKGRVGIKKTSLGWKYIFDEGEVMSETHYFNHLKILKIDADFYNIEFIKSDEFKLEYTYNLDDGEPLIQHKDNVLSFSSASKTRKLKQRFTIGMNFLDASYSDTLKIYYNEDTEFENLEIKSNGRSLNLSNINVRNLIIYSEAQKLTLKNITGKEVNIFSELAQVSINNISTDLLSIDSSFSDITIEDASIAKGFNLDLEHKTATLNKVTAKNTVLKSQFATIKLRDSVFNNLVINSELGDYFSNNTTLIGEIMINSQFTDLKLGLVGNREDYGFDINTEFTKVKINNENIKNGFNTNNDKQSFMDITAESGSIEIAFNKN